MGLTLPHLRVYIKMNTQQQAQVLKEVILKNESGFTCDFNGHLISKDNGFFIAITNIKGKNLNHLIRKVLYIKWAGFNHLKNLLVGGWKDTDNNFYLDLSLYTQSKEQGLEIARLFNQRAIYDIQKCKGVYLK